MQINVNYSMGLPPKYQVDPPGVHLDAPIGHRGAPIEHQGTLRGHLGALEGHTCVCSKKLSGKLWPLRGVPRYLLGVFMLCEVTGVN